MVRLPFELYGSRRCAVKSSFPKAFIERDEKLNHLAILNIPLSEFGLIEVFFARILRTSAPHVSRR
jgi:hypothetical protein